MACYRKKHYFFQFILFLFLYGQKLVNLHIRNMNDIFIHKTQKLN